MDCRKERISVGKINLSVITAGPRDGAAVVVLHGFPERAESWQVQIDQLVKQGFFVIAPEQRGYDESDKPKEVSAYRLDTLAQDILLIMDHYQIKEAHLIGHDWGCVVGWYLVSFHADRIKKAVLLSSPHWEVFRKHLLTNPKQMLKSWYMFAIQLPFLPEMIIQSGHFHYFQKAIASSSFFLPIHRVN